MPGDGPPLSPGGRTARGWVQRELAEPAYADQRSPLQRLWDWATGRLTDLLHGLGGSLPDQVLIPLLVLLAALVVFALARLRAGHRHHGGRDGYPGVLRDVDLTADQLRLGATASAAAGDLSAAFVDFFRAITRRAQERGLLLPQPGRTAHCVGSELAPFFPAQTSRLRAAATRFDLIRYGGVAANAADVEQLRALDRELQLERPHQRAERTFA